MIKKGFAFVVCMFLLVGVVVSQAGEGQQGTVREPIMGGEGGNEVIGERISVDGQVLMEVPRGFEIEEIAPGVISTPGATGSLDGNIYRVRNTGVGGARHEDSKTIIFGESEIDVPLFSDVTFYKDTYGNSFIYDGTGGQTPLTIKTPDGQIFENIELAEFKISEEGKILKAKFLIEDVDPSNLRDYVFEDLYGNFFNFQGSNLGQGAQIYFDAEKKEFFGHLGYDRQIASGSAIFKDHSGNSISLIPGNPDFGAFPNSFSAKFDSEGEFIFAQIKGGTYTHNEKDSMRLFYNRLQEGDKQEFFVSRLDDFTNTGNGVYIYDSEGVVESAYVYGDLKMISVGSLGEDISPGNIRGYSYQGTSKESWLAFRRGKSGQQELITGQDFIISGSSDSEIILSEQNGILKWGVGGIGSEVPDLDIYYDAQLSRPSTGVVSSTIGFNQNRMQRIRTSTNPSEPTLQTQNTQLASSENPVAQTQEQQVAQRSLFGRLFGSN